MARKPFIKILIIADGGKRKGGLCYGSFSVGGFDGEVPFGLPKVALHTAETSTDAEAEILKIAVEWAVAGVEARSLDKKSVELQIESDSQTLIQKLTGEHKIFSMYLGHDDYVAERVEAIWKMVEGFGKVGYTWCGRKKAFQIFGH